MSYLTNNQTSRITPATKPKPPPNDVNINTGYTIKDVDKPAPPTTWYSQSAKSIKNGTTRIVKSSHPVFGGKEFRVEGTIKEVMDIEDPWMSKKALGNPAVANYLMSQNPPAPYSGKVYYGKIRYLGYCIHENYL